MDRYICVHGHFYQPPRENPWLEVVERQDDAYPFHDWNERITAECYAPNTRARILDGDGRITGLVNNYERMSFNLGPTLLAWMRDAAPATYHDIIEADRRSAERFGGHGSAMAQVYGHAIMPLADERDRRTQIRWGITDFQHRFGRDPDGMWLAETAVDTDTLDLLAEAGIRFTVLSPHQAARVRSVDDDQWQEVGGGQVDPTRPYRVSLPSGRSIAVFFYDGPISQAVAFEGLLVSADRFERRLLDGFSEREGPQLVHIATDGESYGHHHRHGEMALAATLERLRQRDDVQLTNYAQYLSLVPPDHEVEIIEPSSWSCSHGVERWRSDCGCGSRPGRHQRWRAPLRAALAELRAALAERYEQHAGPLLADPWAARDDYLDVVLDRDGHLGRFLARHATHELDTAETSRALHLLEMQRHSLLMDTSCGWFFDELSRIEPVQVLRYAARAIQLARDLTGDDLEPQFLSRLATAESNEPAYRDGRRIYDRQVRPSVAELEQVGAHFAISTLLRDHEQTERIGAFELTMHDHQLLTAGRSKLASGRLTVRSVVTWDERRLEFGVLHLGDHNFTCGIRPWGGDDAYHRFTDALAGCFDLADLPGVIRVIDEHLGSPRYSLATMFRDERQHLLDTVLAATLEELEATYRTIYQGRAPLMRFLAEIDAPLPTALRAAAEVAVNADLIAQLSTTDLDPAFVRSLLDEADRLGIELDLDGLSHAFGTTVARMTQRVAEHLADPDERLVRFDELHAGTLERARTLLEIGSILPFEVDLAPAQDLLWQALHDHHADLTRRADAGDEIARRWLRELDELADAILVAPPTATELE